MQWNNKILTVIFFVLLGIYVLTNFINKKTSRSFRSELLVLDTASVDKLILYPKGIDSNYIQLKRGAQGWQASNGEMEVTAEQHRVNSVLSQLQNIPTKRLISKSSEKQVDYAVDEKSGKIVEVYSGQALIEKLIFGRFNFDPNTRSATSYARLADEEDIYSIDGFMSMSFDTDFNSFRNKSILDLVSGDIKQLNYGNLTLTKDPAGHWTTGEAVIDSTEMTNYLNRLSNLSGSDFADDYQISSQPIQVLELIADNRMGPASISLFRDADSFVVKSSDNNAFFRSDSSGLYQSVFGKLQEILPPGEKN